jgi:hypothetical protein
MGQRTGRKIPDEDLMMKLKSIIENQSMGS